MSNTKSCRHCNNDKSEHNFVNDACPIKAGDFTVAFSKSKRFERDNDAKSNGNLLIMY